MGVAETMTSAPTDMSQRTQDVVQPFRLESAGVLGRLIRLGPALDRIIAPHHYPAEVATLLAEGITLASALASGLKYDGIFTLQTSGSGPIRTMVADVTSDGGLRGYARIDAERLNNTDPATATSGPVPRLLGVGHMAFTVDQGPGTERYQGITELIGSTLADCAQNYFRRSEQLETAFTLFAETHEADTGEAISVRSGAVLLQHLPTESPSGSSEARIRDDAQDEAWRRVVILMSTLTGAEILDPSISPNTLLYRLFHEEGIRVFPVKPLEQQCRCAGERVERTLRLLPKSDIAEMIDDGIVTVTCEFCKANYTFDENQIDALFQA
jgi:molecular chaperone Hsp33